MTVSTVVGDFSMFPLGRFLCSDPFTIELERPQITQELVLVVHASEDIHRVVNNDNSMTLSTDWQRSKCGDG